MKNTTLCYIKQNDKYLMLHRTKKSDDPNEGKWIGIGGHTEDGESWMVDLTALSNHVII